MSVDELFGAPLRVINLGLESFAADLAEVGVEVVQVDWRPPAGGWTPAASRRTIRIGRWCGPWRRRLWRIWGWG